MVLTQATAAGAADGRQLATDTVGPSDGQSWKCTSGSANGQACFAPLGEWFRIRDTWADGFPVVIQWKFFDDEVSPTGAVVRQGTIWNRSGEAAGWLYVNKTFPESVPGITLKSVQFRACSGDYATDSISEGTCSDWRIEAP
ncbi:hypothetical protein GT042_37635 [Streptomyces sp. SID3212]|nr:hypothetical protein [Streptomyces sp. SID3212]